MSKIMKLDDYIKSREMKNKATYKYSNKQEVKKKWVELCKRLNSGKQVSDYFTLVIELLSLLHYVLSDILDDRYIESDFMKNFEELSNKGYSFDRTTLNRLNRIRIIRNLGAHNTSTIMTESVNYELCVEIFLVIGKVLYELKILDKDDIQPSPEKLQAEVNDIVGGYCRLDELIGSGGGGRVFKAYHINLDIYVAVKEINYELKDKIYTENEKQVLLSINHEGIPRIYDVFYDNQTVYLVMDYIDGRNLNDLLKESGPLAASNAIKKCIELCNIIEYLHNEKNPVIFNDLKPSNVILGNDNRLYLVDFGTALLSHKKDYIREMPSVGTFGYSAPELLNKGVCDQRSDVYSLGALLYFLVEGINPPANLNRKYCKNTPEYIINVIEKAMHPNPEARYMSVTELKQELHLIHKKYLLNLVESTERDKSKKTRRTVGIVLCLVVISALLFVLNVGKRKDRVYTDTQFYMADFEESLKADNKVIISPKNIYFKDEKLYMVAFFYNGYDIDIDGVKNIKITILDKNENVIASKAFSTVVNSKIASKEIVIYTLVFEGKYVKKTDVDLTHIKWKATCKRIVN
ncbi:MAG TPA: protein kinase [Clostridiaceae bacterium]|nr:protein kinase [Clostridiaceae bacterium]